jgi:hypothetical protein
MSAGKPERERGANEIRRDLLLLHARMSALGENRGNAAVKHARGDGVH